MVKGVGQVCLRAGHAGCTRPGEPDVSGHDSSVAGTQTAPDKASRIIRRAQVHDLTQQQGCALAQLVEPSQNHLGWNAMRGEKCG